MRKYQTIHTIFYYYISVFGGGRFRADDFVRLSGQIAGRRAGGERHLSIRIQAFRRRRGRQSGRADLDTNLNPRQEITSTPYAIRSLNANQASTAENSLNPGGVAASQYVVTTDPRMSDDRNPLAGSANYIQNPTNPQASSNFNISGDGKANILSAATQYNIGAKNVLRITGTNNFFVGYNAGISNSSGEQNTFVGVSAGAGIRNVQITIMFPSGEIRSAVSTTLGYSRFTDIPVRGDLRRLGRGEKIHVRRKLAGQAGFGRSAGRRFYRR